MIAKVIENKKIGESENMYEIKYSDLEKVIETYKDAFSKYPKLMGAFPKKDERAYALEATLRYYCAYDLYFGKGFALDESVNEAVLFVSSEEMKYTEKRHKIAGSNSEKYEKVMKKLTKKQQEKRIELFCELDEMELELDIPEPHLYVDFLGVKEKYQHCGRGKKLMEAVIKIAKNKGIPIMLFTNTPEDIEFYEGLGFHQIGRTKSEKFGFENVYLVLY